MDDIRLSTILGLLVLILLSAFFSACETAFTSANRIRLKNHHAGGAKRAKRALEIIEDYDNALSAVLIGNNIVNLVAASIASYASALAFGAVGLAVSTVIMTVTIIIFGEIIPKSLAKYRAEAFLLATADVVFVFIKAMYPLSFLLSLIRKLFSGTSKGSAPTVTEEELRVIIDEIEDEGVLHEEEKELLRSVLEFDDIEAKDILTPRVDLVAMEMGASIESIRDIFIKEEYTRLPLYADNIDNIVGVLNSKDFFREYFAKGEFNVEDILLEPIYVPAAINISKLLKELQRTKQHMAVVTDEYGGTLGIITLEDILEQLVGEIYDEHDEIANMISQEEDGFVEIDGDVPLDKLYPYFSGTNPEFEGDFTTVSAYILDFAQKIPEGGEIIEMEHMLVQVLEVDRQRITLVKVRPLVWNGLKDKED